MKVLVYEIEVTGGALEAVHGFKSKIREAYFSKYNLFLNGQACFLCTEEEAKERLKGAINPKEEEIEIEEVDATSLCCLIEQQKNIQTSIDEIRESFSKWVKGVKKNDSK